jgi:hypothetical protein
LSHLGHPLTLVGAQIYGVSPDHIVYAPSFQVRQCETGDLVAEFDALGRVGVGIITSIANRSDAISTRPAGISRSR